MNPIYITCSTFQPTLAPLNGHISLYAGENLLGKTPKLRDPTHILAIVHYRHS